MAPRKSATSAPKRQTRATVASKESTTRTTRQKSLPRTRQSLRRSTRTVVPASTGSESSDILSSPAKSGKAANIMIEVPESTNAADYATLSSSSESPEDSVFDKAESGGNGSAATPTVTIPNNTPADSDAAGSSRPRRVNASSRAAQLKNSAFSLGSRAATSKKRPAAAVADVSADEALARTLQAEEYGENGASAGPNKKAKTGRKRNNKAFIDDSEDDSDGDSLLSSLSPLSTSPEPTSRPRASGRRSGYRSPFDLTSLSELSSSTDDDMLDASEDEDNADADPFNFGTDTNLTTAVHRIRYSIANYRRHQRVKRAERERQKLEKNHPELGTMWEDLEKVPAIVPTRDPQPAAINRRLKPFQLEGVNWMRRQEQTVYKGGLLGDEMGMGKTIQAVSLLMSDYPAGKPSLVVVPPVALMQWSSEIASYTDGKLKVLVYHNSNPKVRNLKAKDLKAYDVIMISYSGLESMHRKEVKGWARRGGLVKEDSVIHSIHFHRLILDEAHNIKQRTTSVARACFALKSNYKWCLSGTPVQNRIGEFFSLLRFLEVKPFACYFCKKCDCSELHWSQNEEKKCTVCGHNGFQHVSVFNQEILNPITEVGAPSEKRKAALKKLRLLTDKIMLRRMKQDHTSSMELPPKRIEIHNEFFGEMERDFSTSIMTNSTRQFDTYVSRGVMLNNYANIFGLIMQMRQVANHPDLILKKHSEGGQNVLVCCICDEPAEEAVRSRCKHEFCRQCVKDYIASFGSGEPDCPRCHIALSIDLEQPDIEQHDADVKKSSIINRIRMDNWTSSTKIEMLVYDLYKLRSKKQTHKSIVFSQFTSMLQLVEWRLRRAGINTVMLDGSMTPAQRQKSIEYFMNNVDVEVFLVSLKAGGVALNLTEASRVFIIDPWWNPAAEWQSADRCHRIGQRRPCVITRLCIEDSVESRMVLLQEKKANMIRGTLNKDQTELLEKLTPQDMQFLFRGS